MFLAPFGIYFRKCYRISFYVIGYVTEDKTYAAVNFTRDDIDTALAKGYIMQEEYDETIALIPVPVEENPAEKVKTATV